MRLAIAIVCIAALAGCAAPTDTDADAASKERDGSGPSTSDPTGSSGSGAITPTTLPPPPPEPAQTYTGFVLTVGTVDGAPAFLSTEDVRNPTLLVPAGEQITIDLIRRGELHALTVNGVGIIGAGTEDVRGTFRAPDSGSVGYDCPIHPGTMRGTITVA